MRAMTRHLSNFFKALGFWLSVLIVVTAVGHRETPPAPQPGNECRVWAGLYLPCSKVGPTNYPDVWLSEGQDI